MSKYIFRNVRGFSSKIASLPDKQATLDKFLFPKSSHTINEVNESFATLKTTPITIHGWLDRKPKKISKSLLFGQLRDTNGDLVQVVCKDELLIKDINRLQIEDSVCIQGQVCESKAKLADWDLKINSIQVLNGANEKAAQLEALKYDGNQYNFPPAFRYLQLRIPEFQKMLKKRSLAAKCVRDTLTGQGFNEIETPLLFKSTPEGAREFLVPTRQKHKFYALPQSPQQYKQLLMASGVHKYFQIAKCFRDEDLRADRQPEFTQIDLEMAFSTGEDVRKVVEKLAIAIWKNVRDLDIQVPKGEDGLAVESTFPCMDYIDCLRNYGIDKPDLRSKLAFVDISEYFSNPENIEFPVIEACVLKNETSKLQNLKDSKEYKARVPVVVAIKTQNDLEHWYESIGEMAQFDPAKLSQLNQKLNLQVGDIVAVSTRAELPYENPTPLGRFRQLAIENYPESWRRNGVNKDTFVATWVVNFPLFSPAEVDLSGKYPKYDFSSLTATHHPFTMLKLADYDKLSHESEYLNIRGDHYDLVINGVEVGGGSRRIHDPQLQNYIFQKILKISNSEQLFGHLLKAFDLGCPPHAGLAIGFDRLVAMLLGYSSIKNVIAFPKNQSGIDMVVESPSAVAEHRLREYNITTSS